MKFNTHNDKMQNIKPKVEELQVSWNDISCKLIYKNFPYQCYHSDVNYHMFPNTILSVVLSKVIFLGKSTANLLMKAT